MAVSEPILKFKMGHFFCFRGKRSCDLMQEGHSFSQHDGTIQRGLVIAALDIDVPVGGHNNSRRVGFFA
jgi:hypothetical protein